MKKTRTLLSVLVGLLLVAVLAGCSTDQKGESAPKLDEVKALNLIWDYEMAMIKAVKDKDPYTYVTGLEKQWLDEYLAKKKSDANLRTGWVTAGSTFKLEKATETEAEAILQWEDTEKGPQSVRFQYKPVGGQWKIANHTTADGKWWAPAKK